MSDRILLATTGRGLARAELQPNGVWSVEIRLSDDDVRCLAADPLNPAVVYAGTQGRGVLRSDDAGRTWRPAGLDGMIVKALAAGRAEPGTVYAGTKPARLFVSSDGGVNWTELEAFRRIPGRRLWLSPAELPFTAYVQGIALSPVDPNVLLVGIEAGAVVRSVDRGLTWSAHRRGALRDCHTLAFHASDGNWIYEAGGTGAGVAFSRDAGEHWTQPAQGLDRHYGWACAADPAQPDTWYASLSPMPRGLQPPPAHVDGKANAAIYRMRGNDGWERLSGGLPDPMSDMAYGLVTDPQSPGEIYVGFSNGEVWHSRDYGEGWQALPLNLKAIRRTLVLL